MSDEIVKIDDDEPKNVEVPKAFTRHRVVTTAIISYDENACICATCRFWNSEDCEAPAKGFCQVDPPKLAVINSQFKWAFPETAAQTWCGGWKRRGDELYITEEMLRAGGEVAARILSGAWTPAMLAGAIYEAMTIARLKS